MSAIPRGFCSGSAFALFIHGQTCLSTSNFWLNSGILYESGAHLSAFVMLRLSAAAANT
jgi:hypothetical protein